MEVAPAPLAPNQTIYVNNLSENVKGDALKKQLTEVFQPFGKILDIIAMSSFARRGQAFVVFDNIPSAATALEKMQGFVYEGKPMRINYARSKSDVVAKADGTFAPRAKRELPPKRTAEGSEGGAPKRAAVVPEVAQAPPQMPPGGPPMAPPQGFGAPPPQQYPGAPPAAYGMPPPMAPPPAAPPASAEPPPNKILFLTSLPDDTNEMLLRGVFDQFPGYKEVRLVPGRTDIAFVEYDTEAQSYEAKNKLQGYKIKETTALEISFAKK